MDDSIRIGDYVCLFCEDRGGYVFSEGSSTANSGLFIKCNQSRQDPVTIPDPHTVVFEVMVKNRYKSDVDYRKYVDLVKQFPDDLQLQASMSKAKAAAEAEAEENKQEQKRQNKRHLKYGQIIQLRHRFTGKFFQISETHTSSRDTNYMRVHLSEENGKQAQFTVHPRYKVKTEGDIVQEGDQITLESVKSRGQYIHSSTPYKLDNFISNGSEINLGVERSGCTLVRFSRPSDQGSTMIRGGAVVRLFHKEIEAYLVAEGAFDGTLYQDVILRERLIKQSKPKSAFPSTSALTYWQVEQEDSILNGSVIHWNNPIRLRHMTCRKYLSVCEDDKVRLTSDVRDPNSVFLLHPVIGGTDEATFDSYVRIEHVLSRKWLHAQLDQPSDEENVCILPADVNAKSDIGIQSLKWDKAKTREIAVAEEKQYLDVFTIQKVSRRDQTNFNFVSGLVFFVQNLCMDSENERVMHSPYALMNIVPVNAMKLRETIQALKEVQSFMIVNDSPDKDRQKLLRNLKIVDLLVRYLRSRPEHLVLHELQRQAFVQAYGVLETYMLGNSLKNGLYFAKHIDYFSTQYSVGGEIGEKATTMITELIKDNRKIIDRIPKDDIDRIVDLVRHNKNYRFLDLLGVLCVCESVALPENQIYICDKWLAADQKGLYLIEQGVGSGRNPNKMYVSTDIGENWMTMVEFCTTRSKEEYNFLVSQLNLLDKLCLGRNSYVIDLITKDLRYLTWHEAHMCLVDVELPDALRANYAHLIISLFIDIGENQSFLDTLSISYIYNELDTDRTLMGNQSQESQLVFATLKPWIADFLDHNTHMTASEVGYNQLVAQVLAIVYQLVKFGYYAKKEDIVRLLPCLLDLIEGTDDVPFLATKVTDYPLVEEYQAQGRFECNWENQAIVETKYRAMQVVDLLLNLEFNSRLERFYGLYKKMENTKRGNIMSTKLEDCHDTKLRQSALSELNDIIESTALFDKDMITASLLDLLNYKYDKMVTKSMYLLNKYFSSSDDLFRKALQGQVLISKASIKVHKSVRRAVPMLKRLYQTKIGVREAHIVVSIMSFFKGLCHLLDEPDIPHPINQTILLNHGMLEIIFDLLSRQVDTELMSKYESLCESLTSTLEVLTCLIRGNADVQQTVFNRLDTLLNIEGLDKPLANALTEVFTGNQVICQKVLPKQIEKLVKRVAEVKAQASEYLILLNAIVKVEELDLPLKRNQDCVMRAIMANYHDVAYMMRQPQAIRLETLWGTESTDEKMYYVRMVDLLATCAEHNYGENRFIESVCQTILSVVELVDVLNDDKILNHVKRPFLRFLLWVYVASFSSKAANLIQDLPYRIPKFLNGFAEDINSLTAFTEENEEKIALFMKNTRSVQSMEDSDEMRVCSTLSLLLDAGLPFMEIFFRKGLNIDGLEADNIPTALASALLDFHKVAHGLFSDKNHLQNLTQGILSVVQKSHAEKSKMKEFLRMCKDASVNTFLSAQQKKYNEYYFKEVRLNERLRTFSGNYNLLYKGENLCEEQLGCGGSRPYNEEDAVPLPLGKDFQSFVAIFIDPEAEDKYHKASNIIRQLQISAFKLGQSERNHPHQVELDFKCIQILRAMIHNQERRLPTDWEKQARDHEQQLEVIEEVQDAMNRYQVVHMTLPLIERQGEVAVEYLSFLTMLLFNACSSSQEAFGEHCKTSRDESFFVAIREKLQLSMKATTERRLLAAFVDERHRGTEERKLALTLSLQQGEESVDAVSEAKSAQSESDEVVVHVEVAEDEGHVELVLRCLALMCDGQNKVLQDYLREQPENMKSVNLVAEATSYLSLIYSSISASNVDLCSEIFKTLNEFASGNPANRNIIFEHGIVDYINHILRSGKYYDVASEEQALDLEENIQSLIMTMIEEFRPETFAENKEICTTLDLHTIKAVANQNFQLAKGQKGKDEDLKDDHMRVAFGYHFLIEKAAEYTQSHVKELYDDSEDTLDFFWENSRAVEVVKDGELQKIHFRIRDENVLRKEVKEMCKWNVDRSSSSSKIRELMFWSSDIIEDIYYQLEVRKHVFADFLIKYWTLWNRLCILLSLLLHSVMLATWKPKAAIGQIVLPLNLKELPPEIYDPVPVVGPWFPVLVIVLGIAHNICSLFVFITYFLTARPRIPKISRETIIRKLTGLTGKVGLLREVVVTVERKNQLRTDFFGVETVYYCIFLVMSFLGTCFWGYFFAFHLFNVVANNPILQRVVNAVTRNGQTLVWVAILVVIVVYNFALTAFALYRSTLDPYGELPFFGFDLLQTFVTVLRYGIVGELYEKMKPHYETEIEFNRVAQIFFFQMAMWTAIHIMGHNLFLGVIIDTFGELRGLKNQAENDMKKECYICGRESYEFESQAKGFQYHVKNDHNMWAYVFFFIHLKSIKETDYTTLELYIHKKIAGGKFDFFPIGRAMALDQIQDNVTEEKLDLMAKDIKFLLQRAKQEEIEKQQEKEKKRQKEWKTKHRDSVLHDRKQLRDSSVADARTSS